MGTQVNMYNGNVYKCITSGLQYRCHMQGNAAFLCSVCLVLPTRKTTLHQFYKFPPNLNFAVLVDFFFVASWLSVV